jgi:hypothetical protein
MADDVNKKFNVKSLAKLLLGVFVMFVGIFLTIRFFGILVTLIAGSIGPFLILAGLVMIAVAKE